jgi:hypothetical protein
MTLIIGSTAIRHHFPDFPREPKDWDVFSPFPYERRSEDSFWHPAFEGHMILHPKMGRYATPDELYTIKISHSYWVLKNGSWDKHMHDAMWLKARGAVMIQPLHDTLYRIWEEIHGKKRVNLQQEAEDFFNDAVPKIWVHDSIHESVAYGEHPMYERLLADGASVGMDMGRVWQLSHEDRVKLFREETYAIALERFVIPSDYTCSPMGAYAKALKKVITSLTKGKSAQFVAEHYDEFRKPDMDYVAHHKSKAHKLIKWEGEGQ